LSLPGEMVLVIWLRSSQYISYFPEQLSLSFGKNVLLTYNPEI